MFCDFKEGKWSKYEYITFKDRQNSRELIYLDNAIYRKYNDLDLRRTAPYLVGIESELLSLNNVLLNGSQWPVPERTDIREGVHDINLTKT